MKIIFLFTLLLSSVAASAQTDTAKISSSGEASLEELIDRNIIYFKRSGDTTGMGQYGARLYDPRMGRYMPADPNYSSAANPYGYAKKGAVKKKPVKKSKG